MPTAPRTIQPPEPTWDPSIAENLVLALGPTLVSVLAGAEDPKLLQEWSTDSEVMPTNPQARRMRAALQVWKRLEESDGADVARLWFLGANPMLGEASAIEAISQDRFHSVQAAMENFVLGG